MLRDDDLLVFLAGELDLATARTMVDELTGLLPSDLRALTLDLGQVSFMDSSGIDGLERVRSLAVDNGIRMTLRSVPPSIKRVLELTGMWNLFAIDDPGER
jgi:anti-sigma B factor antagonist